VNVRELVPFAGAMLLAFALVPIGGDVKWPEYALALALALGVIAGTALTPWQRVAAGTRLLPPAAVLGAAALLRDAGGGFTSGVATLALLPVFWIALHGSRAGLALVMLGVVAFLAVPVLAVGGPDYPASALKTGVLFVAVSGLMGATVQRLVGAVRAQRRELEQLATTDPLTASDNRRAWDSALERALADPGSQPLSVGLLDLDDVKAFNDQHGHEGGDTLLATAAGAWRAELRPGDRLARIGGDEFAVLLQGCDAAQAHTVLARMARATPLGQSCSGGVAEWDGVEDVDALVRRADLALYRAKRGGRGRLEHAVTPSFTLAG
jgi:diguanylate cyclase (GGDEF)-like protein